MGDPLDATKDYIKVDEYLNEYIKRLRSARQGAAEYQKEDETHG